MIDYMKIIKFIADNADMIGQSLIAILGALGLILETINKVLGGKDSALSKLGKIIVKVGEYVKRILDFISIKKPKP